MDRYTIIRTTIKSNPFIVTNDVTSFASDFDYRWAMNKYLYSGYHQVATRFLNNGITVWLYKES